MPFAYGGKYSNGGGGGTPVPSEEAETARKLATAREIALNGDASGSAQFDGSKNIEIPVTINTITDEEIDEIVGEV